MDVQSFTWVTTTVFYVYGFDFSCFKIFISSGFFSHKTRLRHVTHWSIFELLNLFRIESKVSFFEKILILRILIRNKPVSKNQRVEKGGKIQTSKIIISERQQRPLLCRSSSRPKVIDMGLLLVMWQTIFLVVLMTYLSLVQLLIWETFPANYSSLVYPWYNTWFDLLS